MLDEFMKVQQMQLSYMWNKQAAWRAFKDVVEQGLLAYTAARSGQGAASKAAACPSSMPWHGRSVADSNAAQTSSIRLVCQHIIAGMLKETKLCVT